MLYTIAFTITVGIFSSGVSADVIQSSPNDTYAVISSNKAKPAVSQYITISAPVAAEASAWRATESFDLRNFHQVKLSWTKASNENVNIADIASPIPSPGAAALLGLSAMFISRRRA